MALGWESLGIGIGGIVLGGLGTELWRERRAVAEARRIRRDVERETALQNLVDVCAGLEGQVDFMLSLARFAVNGIYNAGTMFAAEEWATKLHGCWRTEAAPYLPKATNLYTAVDAAWVAVQNAFGRSNPPPPPFFDRLRDLRGAAEPPE